MGRTLPTVINLTQSEKDTWKHFRRALRREDQEAFDALWRWVRRHAAPVAMASKRVPNDAMVMAMLVGLARSVMDMERRLGKESADRRVDI